MAAHQKMISLRGSGPPSEFAPPPLKRWANRPVRLRFRFGFPSPQQRRGRGGQQQHADGRVRPLLDEVRDPPPGDRPHLIRRARPEEHGEQQHQSRREHPAVLDEEIVGRACRGYCLRTGRTWAGSVRPRSSRPPRSPPAAATRAIAARPEHHGRIRDQQGVRDDRRLRVLHQPLHAEHQRAQCEVPVSTRCPQTAARSTAPRAARRPDSRMVRWPRWAMR